MDLLALQEHLPGARVQPQRAGPQRIPGGAPRPRVDVGRAGRGRGTGGRGWGTGGRGGRRRLARGRRPVPDAVPRPAQDGLDAGHQLVAAEGLGDEVVGAQVQRHHPVQLPGPAAEGDDRHAGRGPDAPAHLVAVQVGQAEIEQDQVRLRVPVQGLGAGGDAVGRVPVGGQGPFQRLGHAIVVLHDQNVHGSVASPADGAPRGARFRPRRSNSFPDCF